MLNAFDAVSNVQSDRRKVEIDIVAEKPRWVAISVRDNGAGIQPSVADRLFEPFTTTKAKGMGLGLLVTRSIVEDHGGKIFTKPNAEGGTTFTFTLPVVESGRAGGTSQASKQRA